MVTLTDTPFRHNRTSRVRLLGVPVLFLLALNCILAPWSRADDVSTQSERDLIRRMNEQIQELQAKVKELEVRLNAAPISTSAAPVDPGVPVPDASSVASLPATHADAQESHGDASAPAVKLRMFGDVGFRATNEKSHTNSFHLGTLDLFMTGTLSDRVSVLGEVLLIPLEGNHIETEVERLLLQYKHNDHLHLSVGRYHSTIGYYNTAFHQGAWFQTAADRPFMYAFDDEGGFLPLQEVGVTLSGQIPSGGLGLNYVAEFGNGRDHLRDSEPAQNFRDINNGKSVNFSLFARPTWIPGFQTGFSIYHDYVTFPDNINHDELISTIHAVYTNSDYEFLTEGMLVRHSKSASGLPGIFHTPGFYAQFSRRFGKYRPYVRYAYVNAGVAEPIYGDPADGAVVGRRNGPSLGLRFDLNDHSAVKFQYNHLAQRGQQSFSELLTQFSFAF